MNAQVKRSRANGLDVTTFGQIVGASHVTHAMIWIGLSIIMVVAAVAGGLLLVGYSPMPKVQR